MRLPTWAWVLVAVLAVAAVVAAWLLLGREEAAVVGVATAAGAEAIRQAQVRAEQVRARAAAEAAVFEAEALDHDQAAAAHREAAAEAAAGDSHSASDWLRGGR